jgi:hypothetical protein
VHFKNVALSAFYAPFAIAASARVQHLTSDQDIVGQPVIIDLRGNGGDMLFTVGGTVDVRQSAANIVHFDVGAGGFSLGIPKVNIANGFSLPSASGTLQTKTTVEVSHDKAVTVNSSGTLEKAKLTAERFEPSYVYEIYSGILGDINSLNLQLHSLIKDGRFSLAITTDTDKQIAAALEKQLATQLDRLKAEVRTRATAYLNDLKVKYSNEIATFTSYTDKIMPILRDLQDMDGLVERKKVEAEARLKEFANEKLDEAKGYGLEKASEALDKTPIPSSAKDAANSLLKRLF